MQIFILILGPAMERPDRVVTHRLKTLNYRVLAVLEQLEWLDPRQEPPLAPLAAQQPY